MSDFTIIYGSMFSGKTTRLIEEYNHSTLPDTEKIAIKPLLDNRYAAHRISSHGGLQLPGHRVPKPKKFIPFAPILSKKSTSTKYSFWEKPYLMWY